MPSSKKHAPKAVLDTNVWVSALLWGGKPAAVIKAAEEGRVGVFASEEIVGEISQVLNYPKIAKAYQPEGLLHEELIEAVLKVVKFVEVTKKVKVVLAHSADDKFIDCALAARADYIVSGDKHLLKVGNYKKTRIVSVSEFLQIIDSI
jgi:putative PIN family toxin of toxin-antitoxin system